MAFKPGKRTKRNLEGVNEKLVELAYAVFANSPVDFCIVDGGGYRSPRQAAVYAAKGTGIAQSRHCDRMALDFVLYINGAPTWNIKKYKKEYIQLITCILEQADILKLDVISGIDWNCNGVWGEAGTKEWDWAHIERPHAWKLPRARAARERRLAAKREERKTDPAPAPEPEATIHKEIGNHRKPELVVTKKKASKKKASKKVHDGHC